jgi:hypothetical protein
MHNTRNLFDFSIKELRQAALLLSALKSDRDHTQKLGPIVTPEYNPNSGYVFLIDSNFNIAMLNGNSLEDWHRCPECKAEGFIETLNRASPCCKNHVTQNVF